MDSNYHPVVAIIVLVTFGTFAAAYYGLLRYCDWLRKQPKQVFHQGSMQVASLNFWVRERFCPADWSSAQKKRVITLLWEGKSARAVARSTGLSLDTIKRIKRVLDSGSIAQASRNNIVADQSGAVAVEFVLLTPLLLLLIFGGIDAGWAMYQQQRLQFAAESAARCGGTKSPGCGSTDATREYAINRAIGAQLASFTATIHGCGMKVEGSAQSMLIPLPWLSPFNLSAEACYPYGGNGGGGLPIVEVAQLGECNMDLDGQTKIVTDANNPVYGHAVSGSGGTGGGGEVRTAAICDGSAAVWKVN